MKKTLFSLMLDEDVVRAVDQLAHRRGCSRSALVNQLLAEELNLMTPERRIGEVLQALESLFRPDPELVPFFAPNALSMSMKSALDYKYRPTVKYEVSLHRGGTDTIGELSVIFRTQSAELLNALERCFRFWQRLEERYLAPKLGHPVRSALGEGKFTRSLFFPGRDCSAEELAEALSDYVHLFDRLLKGGLSGRLSPAEMEEAYAAFTDNRDLLI